MTTGNPLAIGATISFSGEPYSGVVISFTGPANAPTSVTVQSSSGICGILPSLTRYNLSSGGYLTVTSFSVISGQARTACCNNCGNGQNSAAPCGNMPLQSGQGIPCC